MDISAALREAKKAEGWTDAHIAVLCSVHQMTANRWVIGKRRIPGDSVVILQRASKTFRVLTLGDESEAA